MRRLLDGDRLMKPAEVAAIFGCDKTTVVRWAAAGRIKRVLTPGGQVRLWESEVRALLAERTAP